MRLISPTAIVVSALAALLAGGAVFAQAPAPAGASFDVASVKPSAPGATQVTVNWQGGVTMVNVPLRAIVQFAYGINTPSRIIGHPDWTNVERFDILARPPEGVTGVEQLRPMLQALLVERFGMVARLETREVQAYALVTARDDGRLGPELKPSTEPCLGPRGEPRPAMQCITPTGPGGGIKLNGVPMAQLAPLLSLVVGRPVADRTGLAGVYNLSLRFSGEPRPGAPPPDPDAPSIFTALQEQLGLKLEAEREDVEVLVIERIDRPTEN